MCLHPDPTSSVISQCATFPHLRNSVISSSLPRATALPLSPSRPSQLYLRHTIFLLRIRSQTTSDISTPLSFTSAPSDGSALPRKRRHEEPSEHDSRSTASTGPNVMCRGPSSPLAVHSSTPVIPQRIRVNLVLMPPLPNCLSRPNGNCDIPLRRRADTRP